MNKLLKLMKTKINNENGSISIYIIIFMVFFLPFALWVGSQVPLKYEMSETVRQMTYNTADSMISRLDQSSIASGHPEIDVAEAMSVADSMLRKTMNLDIDGNPTGKGMLKEQISIIGPFTESDILALPVEDGDIVLPTDVGVYVYVLNNPSMLSGITIKGLNPILNNSVIVRANIPLVSGGLGGRAVVHQTGVSEVSLNTGVTP